VIADQLPAPGGKMVSEGHWLGALQVGVAGHKGFEMGTRYPGKGSDEGLDLAGNLGDSSPEEQSLVKGNLIVAASSRVYLLAGLAKPVRQHALDEGMDVFRPPVDGELPALQVGGDSLKLSRDGRRLIARDNAALAQHGRVGDAALDVVKCHS
jgi:hypothetical protein